MRASWHLRTQWVVLQERSPELRKPQSLRVALKQTCPTFGLHRDIFSVSESKLPSALEGDAVSAPRVHSTTLKKR